MRSSDKTRQLDQILRGTPYRAVACMGSGGMGEIYEAIGGREKVVVKLLRPELAGQADYSERMRVEGEAIELLSHPHIVGGRRHGATAEGLPYVAMERLYGPTLRDELRRRGALPVPEAARHTRQLLAALRAVHDAGLVHRDVKPENIIICRNDSGATLVKLLDFGIAKVRTGPRRLIAPLTFPTMDGLCVGTPRYISPEQAAGGDVDPRADIYAAGLLLYLLVAGRGPFDDVKGTGSLLKAHQDRAPPPPSRVARVPIPPALDAIILRAIAKDPNDRFADAVSFSRELLITMGKLWRPRAVVGGDAAPGARSAEATRCAVDRDTAATVRIAPAADRSAMRARLPDSRTTILASRFDELPTVIFRKPESDAPAVPVARSVKPSRVALGSVSGAGVILSAAAFGAAAGVLGMWFVR